MDESNRIPGDSQGDRFLDETTGQFQSNLVSPIPEDLKDRIYDIKPKEVHMSTASSGYVWTVNSTPSNIVSAIDKDQVYEYFKLHDSKIYSITEQHVPGCLTIKLNRTCGPITLFIRDEEKEFEGYFFFCGKCMAYCSKKNCNITRHISSCLGFRDENVKKEEQRIKNRERMKIYRRKKKIEQAKSGIKPPKRKRYERSEAEASPANLEANQSTSRTNENSSAETASTSGTYTSNSSGSVENAEHISEGINNSGNPEDILETEEIEIVQERLTVDTENFVPIRDTDEEVVHNMFNVKLIDFIECIQDDEKVGKIWKPEKCQVGLSTGENCNVNLRGTRLRERAFDLPLPVYVKHRVLHCTIHNKEFNYLSEEVSCQMPQHVFCTHDIVVLDRTIMTREFYNYVIREYEAHFNPSRTYTTTTSLWVDNAITKLRKNARLNFCRHSLLIDGDDIFDPGNPKWQDVLQLSSFTPNLITKIIRTYWKFEVEDKYETWKIQFYLNTKRLSGDHTYSVVKNIGVYETIGQQKSWVGVKASLFTLLNQDGHLVDFKICPTDEFKYVGELLKDIWTTQHGHNKYTEQYHTDNVAKDRQQVLKVFEESFDGNTPPLEVIQDLWHARMRVERKMNRARKRFSQAVYELQHIFSRFKKKKDAGGYSNEDDVRNTFQQWVYSFMKEADEAEVSELSQLMLIGRSLSGEFDTNSISADDDELISTNTATEFIDPTFLADMSEDLLSLLFDTDTFVRAEESKRKVDCCSYRIAEDHQFQCRVVGQHHRVYSVNISVLPSSKAQDIESRFKCVCTCPAMCARCKHVAAALLSWKRSPQNWEETSEIDTVKPGDFNDGPVTLDTVKAVNNILKPNVLPYLMVLSTREDTRGTTLNENFHRFIGTELGKTPGIQSMEMKEIAIKMCHMKFNKREKTHKSKLQTIYEDGVKSISDYFSSPTPSTPSNTYILPSLSFKTSSKSDLSEKQFKNKKDRSLWSVEDIDKLCDTLKKIASGDIQPLSSCPYYWIAHHIFDRSKTKQDIKQFIKNKFTTFTEY